MKIRILAMLLIWIAAIQVFAVKTVRLTVTPGHDSITGVWDPLNSNESEERFIDVKAGPSVELGADAHVVKVISTQVVISPNSKTRAYATCTLIPALTSHMAKIAGSYTVKKSGHGDGEPGKLTWDATGIAPRVEIIDFPVTRMLHKAIYKDAEAIGFPEGYNYRWMSHGDGSCEFSPIDANKTDITGGVPSKKAEDACFVKVTYADIAFDEVPLTVTRGDKADCEDAGFITHLSGTFKINDLDKTIEVFPRTEYDYDLYDQFDKTIKDSYSVASDTYVREILDFKTKFPNLNDFFWQKYGQPTQKWYARNPYFTDVVAWGLSGKRFLNKKGNFNDVKEKQLAFSIDKQIWQVSTGKTGNYTRNIANNVIKGIFTDVKKDSNGDVVEFKIRYVMKIVDTI